MKVESQGALPLKKTYFISMETRTYTHIYIIRWRERECTDTTFISFVDSQPRFLRREPRFLRWFEIAEKKKSAEIFFFVFSFFLPEGH